MPEESPQAVLEELENFLS